VKFPQKTPLWGCEYVFSSTTCKILKPAYYLRIDSNQILHNTKDHEVLIVGGPNKRQQIQDGRRPHFEKTLNRHIPATIWPILTLFGTVMHIGRLQWTDR